MNVTSIAGKQSPVKVIALLAGVLVIAGASFLLYQQNLQSDKISALTNERDRMLTETASSTETLAEASSTIASLTRELNAIKKQYGLLSNDYSGELDRNNDFEQQIRKIGKTVGVLDKLSKTDQELLQKYSKIYFLNEHYVPEKLDPINKDFVYTEGKNLQLHSKAMSYYNDLVQAAKDDGIDLWAVSAYRSFETQAQLKGAYTTTYGSGANAFSADQGYSEHQLGTTVDFTTKGLSGGLSGFQSTPAYTWLKANAYKYGFVLSYPEGNKYYVFEPWHWRFVGEKLARDLNKANAHFYDWDQRKIDGYLINIFD